MCRRQLSKFPSHRRTRCYLQRCHSSSCKLRTCTKNRNACRRSRMRTQIRSNEPKLEEFGGQLRGGMAGAWGEGTANVSGSCKTAPQTHEQWGRASDSSQACKQAALQYRTRWDAELRGVCSGCAWDRAWCCTGGAYSSLSTEAPPALAIDSMGGRAIGRPMAPPE